MQICVYELRIYHVNSKCAAAENNVKDVNFVMGCTIVAVDKINIGKKNIEF